VLNIRFLEKETKKGGTVSVKKHIIDFDVDPFIPGLGTVYEWKVVEHRPCGQFEWDSTKIKLWLSSIQQTKIPLLGEDLRQEIASQLVLNANVLDYLLANQELIPIEWRDKDVCFWGTTYQFPDGSFGVRCLIWSNGWAPLGYRSFDEFFDNRHPAAVLSK